MAAFMFGSRRSLCLGVLLLATGAATALFSQAAPRAPAQPAGPPMRRYDSPYYVIHTDLEPNLVREAYARLTAMAEEYYQRTKGFGGAITSRRPFYLFSREEDYLKAGGPAGSAGVYTGDRLMAQATDKTAGHLWHVVQHEGFHQFAHKVISGRLPVWVSEGMAEYFGEGVWTGDGMVTGVIPPSRLKKVRRLIRDGNMLPFAQMIEMGQREWSGGLSSRNYDQAWSMVHFLVNGDGGRYCQLFTDFLNDVSRGGGVKQSFRNRFGRDDAAFQSRYEEWWTGLGDNPTADVYAQAAAATLTSFLARAEFLKMKFASAEEFLAALKEGKVQVEGEKHPRLWLPVSLGRDAAALAEDLGEWTLQTKPARRIILKGDAGGPFQGTITGAFTLSGDQRPQIQVKVEKPKTVTTGPAK